MQSVARALVRPVDGTSLAVVRIALGLVAVLSAARTVAYGWTDSLYAAPTHRFTYLWMAWVPQPGPVLIRILVATTAVAGVAIVLGWHTRIACSVLLVAFGWIEFIDATTYLNHYWFVTLLAALGLVVPFGADWSLDARRAGARPVVAGWVWLLRFQVGVVYSFAGLAKLQSDWLVDGLPLGLWLPARMDRPLIGSMLVWPETAHVLSVAGAVFDCSIVALLLWRRTRLAAWIALVGFHAVTWFLFPIGVFPWLMIAMATVFFAPDWPRQLAHRLRRSPTPAPSTSPSAAAMPAGTATPTGWRRTLLVGGIAGWIVVQLALPLRHLAYPGDHRWTAEGYRFGWNVLLVERAGSVTFLVTDPAADQTWTADASALYTPAQLRVMTGEPDFIHQAALAIGAEESAQVGHPVEVRVDAWLSFNGRPAARWIDPTVDLAAEPRNLRPKDWILPRP